jgi:hypothetical protein
MNDIKYCAICLSNELESNKLIDTMTSFETKYYRYCNCNSFVHKECLMEWYKYQKKCIICRKYSIFKLKKTKCCCFHISYTNYYLKYFNFYCNILLIAIVFTIMFCFLIVNKNRFILIKVNNSVYHNKIYYDESYIPY